jgi:cyanophycinase
MRHSGAQRPDWEVQVLVQLIGGGWRPEARPRVYGPFLEAAGTAPDVACVVVDEGDGMEQFGRWRDVLTSTASCSPAPVLVPVGERLSVADLDGADALLVCGGLTPAYADALAPVAGDLRAWLRDGDRPFAGFSAGAAVAASRAVVGGWLCKGVPVCPDHAAEDLDEVRVTDGLGLVPFAVDVHCSAWGTLGRLVSAVHHGQVARGVALDEDTALSARTDGVSVTGTGNAYVVEPDDGAVAVRVLGAGSSL